VGPDEGRKSVQRAGALLLGGKAGRFGAVQLQGDCIAAFQYLKGPTRKLEGDFLQGHVGIGQGVMTLN